MTTMKRMSIVIPEKIDKKILEMKKSDEYVRCSYAEIVRILIQRGLDKTPAPPA